MMPLTKKNLLPIVMKRFIKHFNYYKRHTHSERVKFDKSELWTQPDGYNTGIKIYNPILKDKVDLVLKRENIATWYCCGPTVYDSAHIGHASCYVKFDVIRRILEEWFNINVIMVMGITDIDDKIIRKANEMKTDFQTISTKYEVEFFNDISNLNLLPPTLSARVSDYIPNIIEFIDKIIVQGYAYVVPSGSVYFKTTAFKRYNKFGLATLDEEYVIDSQDVDECKQSPFDFVLWKAAKPSEPYWSSPWGPGRPGWHIECSAIASAVFGSNIDLHSGGIDLKFPHHENEEAQSCSHHCVDQWVNYWMYSGHLHFKGGEKMSKSLKNTLSIDELLQKYTADEFRILCLMSPYRNAVEYSDAVMKTASGVYRKIEAFIHTCDAYIKGQLIRGSIDEELLLKEIVKVEDAVRLSLRDDFNTSLALSCLLDLISTTNGMINENCENVIRNPFAVAAVLNFIKDTFIKFGLCLDSVSKERNHGTFLMLSNVLDAAVDFRCDVRQIVQASGKSTLEDMKTQKKKLFNSCDDFRNKLNNIGVELQDHGNKSSWKIKENINQDNDAITNR